MTDVETSQPVIAAEPVTPVQKVTAATLQVVREWMEREPLHEFPPTESGQAQAFSRYCGERLCFSPGRSWLVFDPEDARWRADIAEPVVFAVLDFLARERGDLREAVDRRAAEAFARAATSFRSIRAVSELARRLPGIFRLPDEFDADPLFLNCRGLCVDLRTGETRDSRPGDLFTMTAGCRPEAGPMPEFFRFMDQVTLGRADLTAWLMRWFGYALTGDMNTPYFTNVWGAGRNGKGALLRLMRRVFGSYAIEVAASVVVDDGGKRSGPRPDLVDLMGPRLGVVDEVPPGKLSIEVVKRLTGGDAFRADRKFQDTIEFQPRIKLTLVSNNRLELRRVDTAIVRRFQLVPFSYQVPKGEEDPRLEDRLAAEAPAVLAWLIEEAAEYLRDPGPRGFPPCETIDAASREYVESEDLVGRFLEERCERIGSVQASELYRAFALWCESEGLNHIPSPRFLGEELIVRGFDRKKTGGVNRYFGLNLRGI